MSSQIEYIKYIAPNSKAKTNLPVTIEWLGSRMIRNHSIKATVKEILTISESLDVVKINIIEIIRSHYIYYYNKYDIHKL